MASPLPPGANGNDVVSIVFAGCGQSPAQRAEIGLALGAWASANAVVGGVVGVAAGFGLTWLVLRSMGKKGRI